VPSPSDSPFFCSYCEEPILFLRESFDVIGTETGPALVHVECLFRTIAGSAAHILMECRCYGGTCGDPEGMSRRDSAILAFVAFRVTHHRLHPASAPAPGREVG
jgi:hypothetical protein